MVSPASQSTQQLGQSALGPSLTFHQLLSSRTSANKMLYHYKALKGGWKAHVHYRDIGCSVFSTVHNDCVWPTCSTCRKKELLQHLQHPLHHAVDTLLFSAAFLPLLEQVNLCSWLYLTLKCIHWTCAANKHRSGINSLKKPSQSCKDLNFCLRLYLRHEVKLLLHKSSHGD